MKTVNQLKFEQLYSWKWFLCLFILIPYIAHLREKLFDKASSYRLNINQWDLIFCSLSDHLLIFYAVIPIWLFSSIVLIQREWNYSVIIRTKSFSKWMIYTTFKMCKGLFIFQCFWILISFLFTRGIPYDFDWSMYALNDQVTGNYSFILQTTGLPPVLLIILQTTLLGLFLIMLHVSLAVCYMIVQRLPWLTLLAVTYFIGALVSSRMVAPWYVWLRVENFMILASAHYAWNSFWFAYIVPFGLILCFYLIGKLIKGASNLKIYTWVKERLPIIIYVVLCLLGILLYQNSGDGTIFDSLYILFYGVSESGYSLTMYLFYATVFFGITFLFQLQLFENSTGFLYAQLIRHRSYFHWFARRLLRNSVLSFIFLLLFAVVAFIISFLNGSSVEFTLTVSEATISIGQLSYHYLINGLLQLINYSLILFIVYWIWSTASISLLVFGFLFVAGLPAVNVFLVLPAGLNSFGYLNGDFTHLLKISLVLILWIVVELMLMSILFVRKNTLFQRG